MVGLTANARPQLEDDVAVHFPEQAHLVRGVAEQARTKKQLRDLRALVSVSQQSPSSNNGHKAERRNSVNKDNDGKQEHHYGLSNAFWKKQTSTQWMTAGRSSMPHNAGQRAELSSAKMRGTSKHTPYVDRPVVTLDSEGRAMSRGRVSLDPYDLNAPPQLPAKLQAANEKQRFKTLQNFFPKQSSNPNKQISRDTRSAVLYGDSDKPSRGPLNVPSDGLSSGPRPASKTTEPPIRQDDNSRKNVHSSQSSFKSRGRVRMLGRVSLDGKHC